MRRLRSSVSSILIVIVISGCSVLASKEAAIGCQLADIGSTAYCLHSNPNCYETNVLGSNQNLLYALKLAVSWFIWKWEGWKDSPEFVRASFTVIGCAPVVNNVQIGRE